MLGILEEQHPDRARLFMQWQGMDWPLLMDPLNLLGVSLVPVTLAIDEWGIVRAVRPTPEWVAETFIATRYEKPREGNEARSEPPDLRRLKAAAEGGSVEALRRYAAAAFLWGGPDGLDRAIAAFENALELKPGDGPTHFRLGVAYRARHDSAQSRPEDFRKAVEHWMRALDLDPNNYIWRRRIQQYGPRLGKPYPFYDWVAEARRDILARGETPVPLAVEPSGAEFAQPAREFEKREEGVIREPDPEGRIVRDPGRFVRLEAVAVPPAIRPGETARIHLLFRPNLEIQAHWNNEVEDLQVWVDPPAGWRVDHRFLTVPRPPKVVSQETRRVELEVKAPEGAAPEAVTIPGYALYYVCEDVDGTCLYRRQDLAVPVVVRDPSP